jgi:hypothetical protein
MLAGSKCSVNRHLSSLLGKTFPKEIDLHHNKPELDFSVSYFEVHMHFKNLTKKSQNWWEGRKPLDITIYFSCFLTSSVYFQLQIPCIDSDMMLMWALSPFVLPTSGKKKGEVAWFPFKMWRNLGIERITKIRA